MERLQSLTDLPPSHREVAQQIADHWSRSPQAAAGLVINLCGDEQAGKQAVAASAGAALDLQLHVIRATDVPVAIAEREALARLWEREAVLSSSALLLDYDEPENNRAVLAFLENVQSMLLVASREPLRLRKRQVLRLDVNKPSAAEQYSLWQTALSSLAPQLNGHLETLVAQFSLGIQSIHTTNAQLLNNIPQKNKTLNTIL